MAESRDRGLFSHHKKSDDEEEVVVVEGEEAPIDYAKKEKKHKHLELLSGLTAVASAGAAVYEKHQAKKDPENAHKHKIAEEVLAVAAVGAGGLAFHEHHKKKEYKEKNEAESEDC